MTTLPDIIATYILAQDTPVSLTAIYTRAQGRFDDDAVRKAMQTIHKTRRDIKVTVKDDTCWYSKRAPQAPKAPPPARYRPTGDALKDMNRQLDDYYELCPFVSDIERECYRTRKLDWRGTRDRWKTCECEGCATTRQENLTPQERAVVEYKRIRALEASL